MDIKLLIREASETTLNMRAPYQFGDPWCVDTRCGGHLCFCICSGYLEVRVCVIVIRVQRSGCSPHASCALKFCAADARASGSLPHILGPSFPPRLPRPALCPLARHALASPELALARLGACLLSRWWIYSRHPVAMQKRVPPPCIGVPRPVASVLVADVDESLHVSPPRQTADPMDFALALTRVGGFGDLLA